MTEKINAIDDAGISMQDALDEAVVENQNVNREHSDIQQKFQT